MSDVCGATEGRCACVLPVHDDAVHVCECEGSWEVVGDDIVIRAVPRLDMTTGEQHPWWDPDPMVAMANHEALALERYVSLGIDPLMAKILSRGPITAKRGGISFLPVPDLTDLRTEGE